MRRADAATGRSLALAVVFVAACSPTRPPETPIFRSQGEPIAAHNAPSPDQCAARLRAETDAALAIRRWSGLEAIPALPDAVATAAADPLADLAWLGIPVTRHEREQALAAGAPSGTDYRLDLWVHAGAPERFGGTWRDPARPEALVLSFSSEDPSTLMLAQCIGDPSTLFVNAIVSLKTLRMLNDQIAQESPNLRADGIIVASVMVLEAEGKVQIGVTGLTDAIARQLTERYGPLVRTIEDDGADGGGSG